MQTNLQTEGMSRREAELNKRTRDLRVALERLAATDHASWERPQREHDYKQARERLCAMGTDGKRRMWAVVLQ